MPEHVGFPPKWPVASRNFFRVCLGSRSSESGELE